MAGDDAEILAGVRQAFAACPRPEHFTNHEHCDECFDHDEALRAKDLETLSMADVGNPGWDPICFVTDAGFRYIFPALARLALESDYQNPYVDQLIFHLTYDGPGNRRILACSPEQRRAVSGLLEHLLHTRAELVDQCKCAGELLLAIEYWSEAR